jgi:C4-dicarboxylate transporter DctQ subunit
MLRAETRYGVDGYLADRSEEIARSSAKRSEQDGELFITRMRWAVTKMEGMGTDMKKFWKWLDNDFEETILMVLLILMSCAMMWQVIMRKAFSASMSWPEEFCRFCFIVSGFLSIGYCVRRGKMLKVDILISVFPKKAAAVVDQIGQVITLAFFAYLDYYAWLTMLQMKATKMVSPAMGIPMWLIYGSVFVGALLGVIRQVEMLCRAWFGRKGEK